MKKYIVKNQDESIEVHVGQLKLREGQELHSEVCEHCPLPSRDKFREAWMLKDGQIEIDLSKAKEIKKEELLKEKDKRMKEGAEAFMLAMSMGEDITSIMSKQQALNELESKIVTDLSKKKKVETIDAYDPFTQYEL